MGRLVRTCLRKSSPDMGTGFPSFSPDVTSSESEINTRTTQQKGRQSEGWQNERGAAGSKLKLQSGEGRKSRSGLQSPAGAVESQTPPLSKPQGLSQTVTQGRELGYIQGPIAPPSLPLPASVPHPDLLGI